MEIKISVVVKFHTRGRFEHPDKTASIHDAGDICDPITGHSLGPAILTVTSKHGSSFSLNKKDFDYISREGTKCKYVCFRNKTDEYAVDINKAKELVEESICTKGIFAGPWGPYYVLDLHRITGILLKDLF